MAMTIALFIRFLIILVLEIEKPQRIEGDDENEDDSPHLSTNNSSTPILRSVLASRIVTPRPCGGAEASFWKKFGNVFFTHEGFLILMPGTFNPRIEKHIAMR